MAWLLFSEHFDYRWPSGAVSAYNAGGKYPVKKEVETAALEAKVAEKTSKPADDDPALTVPVARHSSDDMTFEERHAPKKVAVAGHGYGLTGNPVSLPDPADPEAIRADPMVEKDGGQAPPVTEPVTEADEETEQPE